MISNRHKKYVILLALMVVFTSFNNLFPMHLTARADAPRGVSQLDLRSIKSIKIREGDVHRLILSPDERFLAVKFKRKGLLSLEGKALQIFDTSSGKAKFQEKLTSKIDEGDSYKFSPDGRFLAVWFNSKKKGYSLQLFDVARGKAKLKKTNVSSFKFSPDGKVLAVWFMEGFQLFDFVSGRVKFSQKANVCFFEFSPDGRFLVVKSRDVGLQLFDVVSGREKFSPKANVSSFKFSPDGRFLAVQFGRHLQLFDIVSGREEFSQKINYVSSCEFSPDGRFLAVKFRDRSLQLFDIVSGETKFQDKLTNLCICSDCFRFSPDGRFLAVKFRDRSLQLFNVVSGEEAKFQDKLTDTCNFRFSPDGKVLAVEDFTEGFQLFDVASRGAKFQDKLTANIYRYAFSPGGRFLVIKFRDSSLQLFDIASGEVLLNLGQSGEFIFDSTGKRLFVVSGGFVKEYELPTRDEYEEERIVGACGVLKTLQEEKSTVGTRVGKKQVQLPGKTIVVPVWALPSL